MSRTSKLVCVLFLALAWFASTLPADAHGFVWHRGGYRNNAVFFATPFVLAPPVVQGPVGYSYYNGFADPGPVCTQQFGYSYGATYGAVGVPFTAGFVGVPAYRGWRWRGRGFVGFGY